MRLFDLHADIGYDVIQKKKQGITQVINGSHIAKFHQGDLAYVCMASFFSGNETWEDMQEMVVSLKADINQCEEVDLVLTKEDLIKDTDHVKAILTVEGMCGIKEDVEDKIQWLYDQGIRIASFCWNDQNALATGVRGDSNRGLSDMGKQALAKMVSLGMIVDVSHANERTFWDIMENKEAKVIATHSNVRDICDHPRNLWKKQIEAIIERKGIIGAVSAPGFVSTIKAKQDIANLLKHTAFIMDIDPTCAALGFDFMDFYEDEDYGETKGLHDASNAQNIIREMENSGFCEEEMQAVAWQNALHYLSRNL